MAVEHERQNAEETMDLNLQVLVEESADGVLVVNSEGVVQFANAAAGEILARSGDLVGYAFGYPAVSPDGTEIIVRPSGDSSRVVELRAAEVSWDGGPSLLINLRDVTKRHEQEQRIDHLNSALRIVLAVEELILHEESIPKLLQGACELFIARPGYLSASIVEVDDQGEVQRVTEALGGREDLSFKPSVANGLPPCCREALQRPADLLDVVIGSSPECLTCAESTGRDGVRRLLASISSGDQVFGFLTLTCSSVEDAEELELIRRLTDDLGEALRSRQVAAEKQAAEQELRNSEQRFRRLFDNSVDAIMIADETGRYRDVNQAACQLVGYSREDLLNMSVSDLLVPREHRTAGEQFSEFVQHGKQSGTFTFIDKQGKTRTAEYAAFQLSSTQFVSVLRDVTERRMLETRLRQAQKMQAVGRLAGGIAHDFNNLLTAIISFAGFVRDDLEDDHPSQEDIAEVLRAGHSASELTRQLLTFSRSQPLAPRLVGLHDLLLDLQRLLERLLGEDIVIETDIHSDLWPVFIDPSQFEQVIVNLAVNARDAMPNGGTLTLTCKNAQQPGGDKVSIQVTDTGTGMSKDVSTHIFEPFYTTKPKGKGTGLGLATVYGVVNQAGGSVAVESAVGRGTTFEILLPRALNEFELRPDSKPAVTSLGGDETILVIEDEALVRKATERILRTHGYTVITASNGAQGVAMLSDGKLKVDLVLSDVVMPQMSGPEAITAIRKHRPELRVMFMTGYAEDVTGFRDAFAVNDLLLRKPFTELGLLSRVRQALMS